MKKTLIAAIAAVGIVGCSLNRPFVKEEYSAEVSPDGVTKTNYTRTVKATSAALWPASQEVHNQRLSSGKTVTMGTAGISAEATGGTNGVAALQSIERILYKVAP